MEEENENENEKLASGAVASWPHKSSTLEGRAWWREPGLHLQPQKRPMDVFRSAWGPDASQQGPAAGFKGLAAPLTALAYREHNARCSRAASRAN